MTKELLEKVKSEMERVYRFYGDSEEEIKTNVETWLRRLEKGSEPESTITLNTGKILTGVDIHLAVRIENTFEDLLPPTKEGEDVDGYVTHNMDTIILMVGHDDCTLVLYEYDIVDDIGEDENHYINHKHTEIQDITHVQGSHNTIWP